MINFKIENVDISNDVILNSFNYMDRIDDVFGTGSFSFESKTIDYNIPPYSVLQILNRYFLCNSEATYHYGSKSWYHKVSIIEATAILSRFLVGSKTFSVTGSNTLDYEKINILKNLMTQKYNVNFIFNDIESKFTKKIEYVFTAGTTLYDALNEIAKNYNYRVKVTSITGDSTKTIVVDFLDLDNLPVEEINPNCLLSKTKNQNAENYCRYLESEANNVIDTTNDIIIDNIYPTSADVKLSEDTYLVKVPYPIYRIKNFWVNMNAVMYAIFNLKGVTTILSEMDIFEEFYKKYDWAKNIYDKVLKKYISFNDLKNTYWEFSTGVDGITSFHPYSLDPKTNFYLIENVFLKRFDITWRLKAKEQYDLLEEKDKPDYIYYTIGSNVIDGFNVSYKNDFWGELIGQNKAPFMQTHYGKEEIKNVEYEDFIIDTLRVSNDANLIDINSQFGSTFGLNFTPVVNPLLIDEKIDKPTNENSYKPYSLSFNKSADFIEFDKINNSMKIENRSMGKEEMIIECDITEKEFLHLYRTVIFEDKKWYVANVQYKATATQLIATLNLVEDYNKLADVISLNSQYSATKNPLQNIIERPIFFETNTSFEFISGSTYIMAKFNYKDTSLQNSKSLIFAPVILKKDNDCYLHFSMNDQYSAGQKKIKMKDYMYKVEDVRYVDEDNECVSCEFFVINILNMGTDKATVLPEIHKNLIYEEKTLMNDSLLKVKVYKDAREKLTFTIKANDCIIK